jgi:hypothetical protein
MRSRAFLFALAGLVAACGGSSGSAPTSSPGQSPEASAPASNVSFVIDSASSRHPISPYIYGVNQMDWSGRRRFARAGRLGGNRWTAYNWENNASNAGTDYLNQNDGYLGGGDTPGEAVRASVAEAQGRGASMIVTVPIAGYAAADKNGDGDVNKTPDYLETRFEPTAWKGRGFSYPPDLDDRVVYGDEFVAWLESAFPSARTDPARTIFYCLDNEPDLWAITHPRIRPTGAVTYQELVDRTVAAASAVKRVAPQALVLGPVSYGWNGYTSLQDAPDASGRDFLDFYLDSLREAGGGGRLVDVLDLHWYPEAQGGGTRITADSNAPDVAAARVQAPRSLWDPSYVETSWISQDAGVGAIRLIPRLSEKIASHYPGTRLAFTEWFYGGGNDISGAIASADVLGIFGREGVFAATLWDTDDASQTRYTDAALDAYSNYDGQGSRFGDTSLSASTSDQSLTSIYASVDAGNDDRMTVIAINKSKGTTTADLSITHPVAFTRALRFQITSSSGTLAAGPDLAPTARNTFRLDLPGSSVTLLVLSP